LRRIRQPMPDATLKRLIMPTQRCHICLRRILHKTTRTLLRLPSGRPFFLPFIPLLIFILSFL
ncbi:hypothetical protein, partial [Escherichia coli]|uniref:hypothetical protein n=2 Tax=Escherichia coli TaxID=562 RepID=UPI001BFCA657